MAEPEWRRLNRANWHELVAVHLAPGSDYDIARLRSGHYEPHAIEEREPDPVASLLAPCGKNSTSPTSTRRR